MMTRHPGETLDTTGAKASGPLCDRHGRRIAYVRVSITERCDYRCLFCRGERDGDVAAAPFLSTAETLRVCRVLAEMGVDSFKITGGEPFMNPDAPAILSSLKRLPGVASVTVTTNGSSLLRQAEELRAARVDCVNVSLNALTPSVYADITRSSRQVREILEGILSLQAIGVRMKLNMVPIHGLNDGEIIPLLEFALAHDLDFRFIELMPIGPGKHYRGLSRQETTARIENHFGPLLPLPGRRGNGPAAYARVAGHKAAIGYISALSQNFCADCNRIRLTSSGFLKTCLHHPHGCDLRPFLGSGQPDASLAAAIVRTVLDKPERHRLVPCPASGPAGGEPLQAAADEAMHRIGG